MNKRTWLIAAATMLGIVALITLLELTNTTYFFHEKETVSDTVPTEGGASVNSPKGQPQNQSTDGSDSNPTTPSQSAPLIAPSGSFVSNHKPNLGGQPTPNTLSSVCTTTPGASCAISFTKNSVTKSLPTQTTDSEGSTYWNNWSLTQLGLTEGVWQIKATAILGTKTLSSTDPLNLEVVK